MKKVVKMGFISVVMLFILSIAITVVNLEEAQAGWFTDVSIKKCDIRLEDTEFDWTGREIRPNVFVSYEGKNLVENVDYTLKYSDNVDAGKGKVKVKGIGEFKSSVTLEYTIWGIDITRECTFSVRDGEVEVYYQGRIVSKNNYSVRSVTVSERLIDVRPSNDKRKEYRTYDVKEKFTIVGKGQYYGTYEHIFRYNETRLERKEDNKPDEPGHGPGPHPGEPGHGPGPHPGEPGHGPGPHPGEPGHGPGPHPGEPGHGPGPHPGGPGYGPSPHPGPQPGYGPRP